MRRPATIAAFLVLVAFVSASAQRGGMRASGGGRGVAVGRAIGRTSGGSHGFASGRSIGRSSGGRAFGGMHAGLQTGIGARPSFRGGGFGGGRIRSRGFHRCFGCRRGFGYPWYAGYAYAGYYDPYWWWDSSSSYDRDYDEDRELALASEMDALSVEEQRLREQEDREQERDQDLYARRSQPREREEERAAVVPETALVFRDQHVEEVRNYAIAGGTLWVLNDHRAGKKIPLAQLDLDATVKMNDDRGVDFQVPR